MDVIYAVDVVTPTKRDHIVSLQTGIHEWVIKSISSTS